MQEFKTLRTAAREKRDRLIAAAKAEYLDTLSWLSAVEKGFLGRIPSYPRKISKAVEESIPLDRPFTTNDIMATLNAVDTSRVWQLRSVNKCMWRMLRKGTIRCLKKSRGGEPAIYIRADIAVKAVSFEDMTLAQVMVEVLGDREMRPAELTVAMLEAGYQTRQSSKSLRVSVEMAMRKDKRFGCENGKWRARST